MMRICDIIFISMMAVSAFGFAGDQCFNGNEGCNFTCSSCTKCCETTQPSASVTAGYFFFTDSKMRKVYDRGGFDARITGSYPVWNYLQAYGSVEYWEKSGRSSGGRQKSEIWQIPVSLGLKALFPVNCNVNYYLTLGPRYFYTHVHNNSSYIDRNMCRSTVGFFANTGLNYSPCSNFFIDVFAEYSYGRTHFHSSRQGTYTNHVQIGGVAVGGGVGYTF